MTRFATCLLVPALAAPAAGQNAKKEKPNTDQMPAAPYLTVAGSGGSGELRVAVKQLLVLPTGLNLVPPRRDDNTKALPDGKLRPFDQYRWFKVGLRPTDPQQVVTQTPGGWFYLGGRFIPAVPKTDKKLTEVIMTEGTEAGQAWLLFEVSANCGMQVTNLPGTRFLPQEGQPQTAANGDEEFNPKNKDAYRVLVVLPPGKHGLRGDPSGGVIKRGTPAPEEVVIKKKMAAKDGK